MEGCRCSLHSSALTIVPPSSSIPRTGFSGKPLLHNQLLKFPNSKRNPHLKKFRFVHVRAQASGTTTFSSETPKATPKDSKDENLAFVAGATGRVGSRAVRELLKLGFRVRAGVRTAEKAKPLVDSVKQLKLENDGGETQRKQSWNISLFFQLIPVKSAVEKLEIVQCDLEKKDQIGRALGNASVVLCCIGASEKEVFDISGPYRIDYLATKNLIEAATVAKVDHFILLTSLGTNKVGFPAAILNLFWGVLIWKRKAEEALIASGIPYTIVRPGGMERPTDAYKETHNTTLSQEDTLFGGQVSNLQVAELMASIAKNRDLSYCKVVEVIAETTAPLTPLEELLKKIPSQRAGTFSRKESSAVAKPDIAPPKSEEPKFSVVEEPVKAEQIAPKPLSPYTAYEDLKPPTSPSPTPSTTAGATKASVVGAGSAGTDVVKLVIDGVAENGPPQISSYYLSPYPAYDDLKPPTSPSPSAPNVKLPSPPLAVDGTASVGSSVQSPTEDEKKDEQYHIKLKPRPLSPFTMYEDLKPPTSPSPPSPSSSKS
ncbi:NAD(P)-binding domain containing protein [Trema orientale]|uniref:NAD(P)-binding domain containing protein n=1 Tax=Trema orientale TaxID=63057 RepID=A0A2P5B4D0_TREOI|nr:NAD(P)-binding domain containing protein [Trema orientale]